mgnify:CR=1 FL=1
MVKWEEIVLRGAALERLAGEHWKMAVYPSIWKRLNL